MMLIMQVMMFYYKKMKTVDFIMTCKPVRKWKPDFIMVRHDNTRPHAGLV